VGTSTTVDQFAGKIIKGGQAVQYGAAAGVMEAAVTGKVIFLANLPSRTMSNVPAKLGASFNIKGSGNPTALLRYTGPAHLLNNPIGAHTIAPRRRQRTAGGNKRRGASVLKFPSGEFADGQVVHPGTTGKRFFEKSKPMVAAAFRRAMKRGVHSRMARVF